MSSNSPYPNLARRLTAALRLRAAPVAIRFSASPVKEGRLEASVAAPNEAGRTGAVPAGCVFWMLATERTFATEAPDHANCSGGARSAVPGPACVPTR